MGGRLSGLKGGAGEACARVFLWVESGGRHVHVCGIKIQCLSNTSHISRAMSPMRLVATYWTADIKDISILTESILIFASAISLSMCHPIFPIEVLYIFRSTSRYFKWHLL